MVFLYIEIRVFERQPFCLIIMLVSQGRQLETLFGWGATDNKEIVLSVILGNHQSSKISTKKDYNVPFDMKLPLSKHTFLALIFFVSPK